MTATKPARFTATARPTVGQTITLRGHLATIVKVYPFGTVDVKINDTGKYARVTGLPFL
jgi:hypothetical protein